MIIPLERRFGGRSWMSSTEVEIPYRANPKRYMRRFDFVAANVCSGTSFIVVGVEVKTSRADFLNEQRDSTKFQTLRDCVHVAYYATPKGLVKKTELPPGAGLLELQSDGRLKELVKPVRNDGADVSLVLAGMLRRSYTPSLQSTLAAVRDELGLPNHTVTGFQNPDWWTSRIRTRLKREAK
jgi:hypothetical protein